MTGSKPVTGRMKTTYHIGGDPYMWAEWQWRDNWRSHLILSQNHFTCPDSFKHRNKWLALRKHKSTSEYSHLREASHQDNNGTWSWALGCNGGWQSLLKQHGILEYVPSDAAPCHYYYVINILHAQTWIKTPQLENGKWSVRVFNGEI